MLHCSVYTISSLHCCVTVSTQAAVQAELSALIAAVRTAADYAVDVGGGPYTAISAASRARHFAERHGIDLSPTSTIYLNAQAAELSPDALSTRPQPIGIQAEAHYHWLVAALTRAYERQIQRFGAGSSARFHPEVLAREGAGTPPTQQAQFGGASPAPSPASYCSDAGSIDDDVIAALQQQQQQQEQEQQCQREQALRLQSITELDQENEEEEQAFLHRQQTLPAPTQQQRAVFRPLRIGGSPSSSSTAAADAATVAESAPRQQELVSHSSFIVTIAVLCKQSAVQC
jgi:hypothetical protein